MEHKYIKDFAIALAVIAIFAFGVKIFNDYRNVEAIPIESRFKELALDQSLLEQIQQIEESIQDRKEFVFTVFHDPLEQNLIVRTRVDLEAEWRRKIESMMRLAATFVDEFGNRKASIAYRGAINIYGVGDRIDGKTILEIEQRRIKLRENGFTKELSVEPIPPRPVHLDDRTREQEYIW